MEMKTQSMAYQMMLNVKSHSSSVDESLTEKGHAETSKNGKETLKPDSAEMDKYTCDICGKLFAYASTVTSHMKIHLEEKSFACKICGKAFRRPSHMECHMRIHTGEKPFVCEICGRAFGDRSILQRHSDTHTKIKRFSCQYCEKSFNRNSYMLKHIACVHGTDTYNKGISECKRSPPCDICGQIFVDNLSLIRHKYIHTGEKEATCSICNKDFTRKSSLNRHMTRKHNPFVRNKKKKLSSRPIESTE